MEFVEGRSVLDAAHDQQSNAVIDWFQQALEALDNLHVQGLLHGDLSPKNLLIDSSGSLRIVDFSVGFGEATHLEMATLPYMAPELIDGQRFASSDLFSLAVIFFEALSGRHPRTGCVSLMDFLDRPALPFQDASPDLAQAHPLLARVLDRMLSLKPENRFARARDPLTALETGQTQRTAGLSSFYPARMIGAEPAFRLARERLASREKTSGILVVVGPRGTGKSRFLREISLEARLLGWKVESFDDLQEAGTALLADLFGKIQRLPADGSLILVACGDRDASPEANRFLQELEKDERTVSLALKDLDVRESELLMSLALGEEAAREVSDFFKDSRGNPGKIIRRLHQLGDNDLFHEGRLAGDWRARLEEIDIEENPLGAWGVSLDGPSLVREAQEIAEGFHRSGQNRAALAVIDRCLPSIEDPTPRSRLLRLKTNLLNETGRYEDALRASEAWFALKHAQDDSLDVRTAKYWMVTGQACQSLGRSGEAIDRLLQCIDGPDLKETLPFRIKALSLLGFEELKLKHDEAAKTHFEKVLSQSEAPTVKAEALRQLATIASHAGDWNRASRLLSEAYALYEGQGHLEGSFWTRLHEGNLAREHDLLDVAETAYAEAEALAERARSDLRRAIVWNNRGVLDRTRDRLAQSLEWLRRAGDILRFVGSADDWANNRKETALTQASLGRFELAARALEEWRRFLESENRELGGDFETAVRQINSLKDGSAPLPRIRLERIFHDLPPEYQVTFAERGDWKLLSLQPQTKNQPQGEDPMSQVLPILNELNQALLTEDDMPKVLGRLMDSAMKIAGAENGFLVLRSDVPDGPIPGFEVAIARNVAKEDLRTDLYTFSLSAVRRALQTGEPVVTDNAIVDPNFKEAKSVQLHQLKSILALPVRGIEGGDSHGRASVGVMGVFYLDHRFQRGLFEGEIMDVLKAFAGIAALALQKGKMIQSLKVENQEMAVKIDEREDDFQQLQKEVNRSRMMLKKEYGEIVGRAPKMVEVLEIVDRITDAKVPVWIYGESGTGKEAIARALHYNSGRAKKAFVTENCSALPESLLESELFGHKKGSFTHATSDKKGLLQHADGGTIFLDEIADMSLNLQAKLLRFLQEGEVRPIGATEPAKVDVRVVSASNRDLKALAAEGKFREDLYYRLNGITVKLPPLRERMEDLPLLADHFLKKIGEREKKTPARLDPQVLRIFMDYSWPGNIRELQNTLETAVLFTEKGVVTRKALSFKPALFEEHLPTSSVPNAKAVTSESLNELPEIALQTLRALRDACYHKGKAAKALGISRRSLYARLERAGIGVDDASLKSQIERHLG